MLEYRVDSTDVYSLSETLRPHWCKACWVQELVKCMLMQLSACASADDIHSNITSCQLATSSATETAFDTARRIQGYLVNTSCALLTS